MRRKLLRARPRLRRAIRCEHTGNQAQSFCPHFVIRASSERHQRTCASRLSDESSSIKCVTAPASSTSTVERLEIDLSKSPACACASSKRWRTPSREIKGDQGSKRWREHPSASIKGDQRRLASSHQWQSRVISRAIRGSPTCASREPGHQRSSEVIRGHQWSSELIPPAPRESPWRAA